MSMPGCQSPGVVAERRGHGPAARARLTSAGPAGWATNGARDKRQGEEQGQHEKRDWLAGRVRRADDHDQPALVLPAG